MDKLEAFAFFCEDARQEMGNKTTYAGVLGSGIILDPRPKDVPEDAIFSLSKLVLAVMVRAPGRMDLVLDLKIRFDGAPPATTPQLVSQMSVRNATGDHAWFAQFHATFPNVPVQPGMQVTADLQIEDVQFGVVLNIQGPSKELAA